MRYSFAALLFLVLSPSSDFGQNPANDDVTLLAGADARIEKYRKGDATVRVVDGAGQPVPDAKVGIRQLRHAFLFGCNAFPLLSHEDGTLELKYEKAFAELFNYATLGFYWGSYEPEAGKPQVERLMKQARWLRDHGIVSKGHPLVWHSMVPSWAPKDAEETRLRLKRRVTNLVDKFAGLIDGWDVVNEAQVSNTFDNGVGAWAKRDGTAAMVNDAFGWARAANPKATLVYNDYRLDEGYQKLALALFEKNTPVDAFGLQSHMHRGEWPLTKVWDVCETFNRLGKPLHFTELTVLSGEHGFDRPLPWPTSPEGEKRQAEYVEKVYVLLFSHPAVQAVTWWDLMDGGWQGAPAGLLRSDMTSKPAYERLMGLIKGKWWSTADLTSDSTGKVGFRGFLGKYRLTATTRLSSGTIDVDLERDKKNEYTVRLR